MRCVFLNAGQIILLGLFVPVGLSVPVFALAQIDINLDVQMCNQNSICEPMIGEDYLACPADCDAPATTTPPEEPDDQSGGGSSGSRIPFPSVDDTDVTDDSGGVDIEDSDVSLGIDGAVSVTSYADRVIISFKTFLPSIVTMSWGMEPSYEIGSLAESWYHQNFSMAIEDLEPATRYYFQITLIDSLGRTSIHEGQFVTDMYSSDSLLPSATHFLIRPGIQFGDIFLTWDLKNVNDSMRALREVSHDENSKKNNYESNDENDKKYFSSQTYVRVTRSEFSFPTHPLEGLVIYEGRGEQVYDFRMEEGQIYFYSLFVMDEKGKYSAPAVIRYIHEKNEKNTSLENFFDDLWITISEDFSIDPLLHDARPLFVERWSENSTQSGFCGFSEPVSQVLSIRDVYTSSFLPSSDEGENSYELSFIQQGISLEKNFGITYIEEKAPLFVQFVKANTDEEDLGTDEIGICIVSKETGTRNHYLLKKNQEGIFEMIFSGFSVENDGQNHYQYTLGMVKYKGGEQVLERGEIIYTSEKNQIEKGWMKWIVQILIYLLIIVFLLFILRRLNRHIS